MELPSAEALVEAAKFFHRNWRRNQPGNFQRVRELAGKHPSLSQDVKAIFASSDPASLAFGVALSEILGAAMAEEGGYLGADWDQEEMDQAAAEIRDRIAELLGQL